MGSFVLAPASAQSSSCPLNFTASQNAPHSLTFHWTGFGGADSYQVEGFQQHGNATITSPMLGADARDYTATGLPDDSYTVWVSAFHSGVRVAESCHITATVGGGLAQPCPDPVSLYQLNGGIDLQFGAIAGATGYDIARGVDGGALVHGYAHLPANQTSFTDTNVSAGHTYTYIVSTTNTRSPPEACQPHTIAIPPTAQVPFFPSASSLLAASVGCIAIVGAALWRRR